MDNVCPFKVSWNARDFESTEKGKNGKLALATVGNKLIKQAVAVAKSELPYDEKYSSINACF